jgi:transcriptional regulator with XRE-family HTH domain
MAARGRKPDHKRRQQAARLRADGLTYDEIAARLGITKQAVHSLLKSANLWQRPRGISCLECGKEVMPGGLGIKPSTRALCLDCLAKHPEATFGERLRAFRLAAGLTVQELASRIGSTPGWLTRCEHGHARPGWSTIAGMIRELGTGLVTLGLEGKPKKRQRT